MNFDIYLGGVSSKSWREELKKSVNHDITFFDPMVDGYDEFSDIQKVNQSARELFYLENGNKLIIFYFNSHWNGTSSLIELGDSVGRNKGVIVCLDGEVVGGEKIRRYCEFRGVLVVDSLKELISTVEEYLSEIHLCSAI